MLATIPNSEFTPPATQMPGWADFPRANPIDVKRDLLPTETFADPFSELGASPDIYVDRFDVVVGKITSYLSLPQDWDGYGGVPPSFSAYDDAIEFLENLPRDIPVPKPMLAGSGEIGLFWEIEGIYVDIGFEGDRAYSFYAEDRNGNAYSGDDLPLEDLAPLSEIIWQLRLFSQDSA